MKIKIYYVLLVLLLLTFSCGSDDDGGGVPVTVGVVESFTPSSIAFINEVGDSILASECINLEESYAIQIEAVKNPKGNTQVSKIEYTLNGAPYSLSFSEAGIQTNPIILVEGKNIAQLVTTAETIELNYVVQDDFELVD